MYAQIDASYIPYIKEPLIDIREEYEYKMGHIPNAINIPMKQLLMKPEQYLMKGTKYYIYCQTGYRSSKTCQILSNLGYYVIEIKGGYSMWQALRKRY